MEQNQRNKRIWNILIIALCIAAILYMVLPTIITSVYSVFIDDDFIHAATIERFHEVHSSYLYCCWLFMTDKYMHWQGNYFSMFIQALLSPANQGGFRMLRIIMVANSVSFFGVFSLFVLTMLRRIGLKDLMPRMIVLAPVIYGMTAFDPFQEVYYWFSGITTYTIPVTVFMLAIILWDKSESISGTIAKRIIFAISLFLMFLVGGGTLALVGAVCWMTLVWVFVKWLESHKISWNIAALFIATFIGAIITVIAPGNYERQDVAQGKNAGGIFNALGNSWKGFYDNLEWLINRRNFALVLLVVFIIGIVCAKELAPRLKTLLISGALLLPLPFVIVFPVVYGYSSYWTPNRCVFVIVLGFVLGYSLFALALGAYTSELFFTHTEKKMLVIISLLAVFLFCCLTDFRLVDHSFNINRENLKEGIYQENYATVRGMIEDLPNHAGEDIELQFSDDFKSLPGFMNFYLCGEYDPNAGFNSEIAYLYGVNSIARIPTE